VSPLSVQQYREQVPVQVVHRIIGVPYVTGPAEVARLDDLVRAPCQINSDTAHFGEVAIDVFGQGVLWMAESGDLGHVDSQCRHTFKVGDDL
jgi:hypothetical protein